MTKIIGCAMMRQTRLRLLNDLCIVSSATKRVVKPDELNNSPYLPIRFYSINLCYARTDLKYSVLSSRITNNGSRNRDLVQNRCFSIQAWAQSWAMWISQTTPVITTQTYLQVAHDALHCPWWLTIVMTTVGLRFLVTFPLSVYAQAIMARLKNLQPEFKSLAQELRKETIVAAKMYEWSPAFAKRMFNVSLKKRCSELIVRENCHPFKTTIVAWFQIPMWISLSFAYRNMVSMMPTPDIAAQVLFFELSAGGLLWFPNLTIPDASLILPVSLGIINLTITEIHALRTLKSTRFQSLVTNLLRVMSIVMIPIAASVPSCLALYWTASSAAGLAQNIFLLYPSVRRICRIPPTESESSQPFHDIRNNLKVKATNIRTKLKL